MTASAGLSVVGSTELSTLTASGKTMMNPPQDTRSLIFQYTQVRFEVVTALLHGLGLLCVGWCVLAGPTTLASLSATNITASGREERHHQHSV